ncbi:MAG: FAD-dependent oxidoreductase [Roseovarius sp.]|nr:FAD-dependent oxidoreductase [Roseovarius sp.]
MKSHARVVVLGGGIHGVSTLYQLALEGWTDAVLIEKGELTSGTTWHAAGQCPNFNGSINIAKISEYSISLYRSLEEKTGQSTGWHQCGGIRLARDRAELDWHRHVAGIARQIGVEAHVIGLDEIRKLHPFVELHDVVGGTYTPNDGHTDPTGATNAIALAARGLGATIHRHTLATDIARNGDEWTVVTDKGNIACEHLVLATGFFTTRVGEWLGLRVPLVNIVHQYLVTDPVPELDGRPAELPVIRDPGSSSYMRQEQKGLLGGPYETEGIRTHTNEVPWSFDMDLLAPDLDHISPWLEMMMARFPLFGSVGVRRVIAGFIAHTPDLVPLVGPSGLRNLWLNCGAAIGIAQGPGCSKYLAQWMVHGAAEIAMAGFDPRRFGAIHSDDWVRDRTIEASSNMYDLHPPGFYFQSGRPLRASPIHDRLKAKGAVCGEAMGWERVKYFARNGEAEVLSYARNSSFAPVAEECRAVRERMGVLDLSGFAKYEVAGAGAAAFLDRVLANRLPSRDGAVGLCHLLAPGGQIDAEMTVTRLAADCYYVLSAGAMQWRDFCQLRDAVHPGEEVVLTDVTDDYGVLVVTGPKTRAALATLTDADLTNAGFPWLTARNITLAGVALRALRLSYAGELGWELHVPIRELGKVYRAVMEAGKPHGAADFGLYALNCLRMEKGYRGFSSELNNEVTLIEAGMERFVAFGKGDFIGREAVARRRQQGSAIRLAYLAVDAPDLDVLGQEPVYAAGELVGAVTSGGFGHSVGRNLAFAYVRADRAAAGTGLEIEMLGDRYPAEVLAEPVWDPANSRLRA